MLDEFRLIFQHAPEERGILLVEVDGEVVEVLDPLVVDALAQRHRRQRPRLLVAPGVPGNEQHRRAREHQVPRVLRQVPLAVRVQVVLEKLLVLLEADFLKYSDEFGNQVSGFKYFNDIYENIDICTPRAR